ncbi:MAG: hypothetical protein U9P14_06795 [Gemmatimonadota bacterium]|nr:hypothetical protein [Gemmatimonadota bacterium]
MQKAIVTRPGFFPQRIWAACDFESSRSDVAWVGFYERDNIPSYPGNHTALKARPVGSSRARSLSIKPVCYPRMDRANRIYFRYFLTGAGTLEVELFNHDTNACHRTMVTGLNRGGWSEVTVDLGEVTAPDGRVIKEGERMGDLVITARSEPGMEDSCALIVDDIICFSGDQDHVESSTRPFPRRVICIWGFDVLEHYHPWAHTDYRVVREGFSMVNRWGAAQALSRENKPGKRMRLVIAPPQHVGERTRLNFRYFLKGASLFQVMIFDLTDRDNRHIVLKEVEQGAWQRADLDFTADGIKNNGHQTPFNTGNLVDDIFFLFTSEEEAQLIIDDLVLYDAGYE